MTGQTTLQSRLTNKHSQKCLSYGVAFIDLNLNGRCFNTERYPDKIPPRLLMGLKEAEGLSQAEYREALNRRVRIRDLHRQLALRADAFITLSSPGPGPVGMDQGSAVFNEGSSVVGMPALSLPLMAVGNVPSRSSNTGTVR